MPKCTFCGRNTRKEDLCAGENGPTCRSCFRVSDKLNHNIGRRKDDVKYSVDIINHLQIKKELDKFIIGQEEAKQQISVEVYKHLRRINFPEARLVKSNIVLVGPSGSGKTFLFDVLSRIVSVPIAIADATAYTEAGYSGKDVHSCLVQLVQRARGDVSLAENGIIYIDEADKMVIKKTEAHSRDIRGEGVQQAFLKIMEGADVEIEITQNSGTTKTVSINTRNILFIFGGAFDGINKIVSERVRKINHRSLIHIEDDLVCPVAEPINTIEPMDIVRFGFIREFIGRAPLIVTMKKLSAEHLKDLLVSNPNSMLFEYKRVFAMDGVNLEFSEDALTYIVEKAMSQNLGARGLRSILSKHLNTIMFEATAKGQSQVLVTKKVLESTERH